MRQGLAPISKQMDKLIRAYAHLDNAIDRCESETDYTTLLNDLEASEEPYADILYQYAWEIMQGRISRDSSKTKLKARLQTFTTDGGLNK